MTKKQSKPKFGVGEWKMRNGKRAVVLGHGRGPYTLRGSLNGISESWKASGRHCGMSNCELDLTAPWPKSKPKASKFTTTSKADWLKRESPRPEKPAKPSPHALRAEALLLNCIAERRAIIRTLPGISAKQKEFLLADIAALTDKLKN